MNKPFRLLSLILTTGFLTACGFSPAGMAPVNVADEMDAEAASSAISVAFNDTYLERIDLNMPRAKKNPKNTDKNLLKLIRGAKKTLDGAFYDIKDEGVVEEIVKAKKRGVKVRLVTDTDNLVQSEDPSKPTPASLALKAAKVPLVDDQRSGIMHHKFMVVDGGTVWTGSTNLTPTSLYCHNNNALTIRSAQLADAYEQEFERLFTRREFGSSMRPDQTPVTTVTVGGAKLRVFFSPKGGGREAVVAELAQAKKSIKFMTFSLTDIETGETMLQKAKSGVKVEGIFDRWLAAGQYSLFDKFKKAKLAVAKDGNEALMHHKVIIVDNRTVITGSYNYSQNAESNNNEAFLIIENAPALATAYAKEFDRLQFAAKHNHPPAHKNPKDPENKTGEGP